MKLLVIEPIPVTPNNAPAIAPPFCGTRKTISTAAAIQPIPSKKAKTTPNRPSRDSAE